MTTGQIGVRTSNSIVPYSSVTKRTKQVSLTVTSNKTGWTSTPSVGIAYADSAGKWRLVFNIYGIFTPVSTDTVTATISGIKFKTAFYQTVSAYMPSAVPVIYAYVTPGSNSIIVNMASATNQSETYIAGDVELDEKPSWADANMEGVIAADIYIPPASASASGIVDTSAQTFAGDKTIQSAGSTQLTLKGIGVDPRMRVYSDSTARGAIGYSSGSKFYVLSESELNLFSNGGSGGVYPVRISNSGYLDVNRAAASGCAFSANSAENVTLGGFYSTLSSGYNAEVMFIYSAMTSGTTYKFIRCDNATQAAIFYVDGRGYIYAGSTTVTSSSDARLKDNIQEFEGGLERILKLKPSTWTWKQEGRVGETKGFVAQDVESVYPEFVEEDENGYKTLGINGAPMIAELVKAIQEQQAMIESLKTEIEVLKNK
jgi:hypothetical protein